MPTHAQYAAARARSLAAKLADCLRAANSSPRLTEIPAPRCGTPDTAPLQVPEGTDLRRILLALETTSDPINVYEICSRLRAGEARAPFLEIDLRTLREAGYVQRTHIPGTDLFRITEAGRLALEA